MTHHISLVVAEYWKQEVLSNFFSDSFCLLSYRIFLRKLPQSDSSYLKFNPFGENSSNCMFILSSWFSKAFVISGKFSFKIFQLHQCVTFVNVLNLCNNFDQLKLNSIFIPATMNREEMVRQLIAFCWILHCQHILSFFLNGKLAMFQFSMSMVNSEE